MENKKRGEEKEKRKERRKEIKVEADKQWREINVEPDFRSNYWSIHSFFFLMLNYL